MARFFSINQNSLLRIATNEIASFCIDHRSRQMAFFRAKAGQVTLKSISDKLGYASCATFLFLPHFDVICDLLLNRRTATWNLFVNLLKNLRNERVTRILGKERCIKEQIFSAILHVSGIYATY